MSRLYKVRELYTSQGVYPYEMVKDHLWRDNREGDYNLMNSFCFIPFYVILSVVTSGLAGIFVIFQVHDLITFIVSPIVGIVVSVITTVTCCCIRECLKESFISNVIKEAEEMDIKDICDYFEKCKKLKVFVPGNNATKGVYEVEYNPMGHEDYIFLVDGNKTVRIKALFHGSFLVAIREETIMFDTIKIVTGE